MKTIISSLILFASMASAEPLKVSVNVTTANPSYAPAFTQCIEDKLVDLLTSKGFIVQFADYTQADIDVYLVTQPARQISGTQNGVAAAIVVTDQLVPIPPAISAVSAGIDANSMSFVCSAVSDAFNTYMGRLAQFLRQHDNQSRPAPNIVF